MTVRVPASWRLVQLALPIAVVTIATPTVAQISPPTHPVCACGPSAMPRYTPPYPKPAVRPLDGSPRSGVTYRQGTNYRTAQTNLGTSAHDVVLGPALWAGLYIGAHGGYGFGKTGGVHLGHTWQSGALVYGIEADIAKSWSDGNRAAGSGVDLTATRDWIGSARGRVGYAFGSVLAYATAGVAVAGQTVTATATGMSARTSGTHFGYVYGAGLEWQVQTNVSLRGEVLRYEFDDRMLTLGSANAPAKLDDTVVRGGLTFRFN